MRIARLLVGIVAAGSCVIASSAWAQPATCPRILQGSGTPELQSPTTSIVWDRDGAGPEAPLLVIAAQAFSDSPTGAQNLIGWDGQKYVRMFTGAPPDVTFAQLFIHAGQLFGLSSTNALVQFNSNSWTTVLPAFGVIKEATSFGGEIVVCGTQQGTSLKGVFALRGGAWVLLGAAFNNDVNSIAIWNGQLVAAGSFTLPGITTMRAAYFDGAAWQPLGTTSNFGFSPTRIRAIGDKVVVGNGAVIAILTSGVWNRSSEGGLICGASETRIYAWEHGNGSIFNPEPIKVYDGQSWTTLDIASQEQLSAISFVIEYQGRVFAMGTAKGAGSVLSAGVNGLELVDSRWRPFGEGPLGPVRSMAIASDGSLVTLCGLRGSKDNQNIYLYPAHPFSRAWDGARFKAAGSAFPGPPVINNPPRSVFYEITSDPEFGLLAGGYFFGEYQGTPLTAVAQYFSDGWGSFGSRLFKFKDANNILQIPKVYKVIRYHGELLALGEFALNTANEPLGFARYQDGNWVAVAPEMALPASSRLRNAFVFDDKLFVVGTNVNGGSFSYFNSTVWSVGNSALSSISPFCVHAGQLYAVGFSGLGVVRWNGSGWDPVGSDLPNATYALASCRGSLFAGGAFGVRKFNGTTWNTLANVSVSGTVQALIEHNSELAIGMDGFAQYSSGSTTNTASGFARFTFDNIPVILQQPISRTGACGETTTLTVTTANYGPTSYHWYKDSVLLANGPTGSGSVLSGVSTKSLVITNLSSSDAGSYTCVVSVSSLCGNTTTAPAVLAATCCPADLNHDLVVDDADFALFGSAYNALVCGSPAMPVGCQSDFNDDGFVDDLDFLIFAVAYDELVCP